MAAQNDIKLVIYGDSEAEFENPHEENRVATRDWKYLVSGELDQIYFGGVSFAELSDNFGLEAVDFHPYLPVNYPILHGSLKNRSCELI